MTSPPYISIGKRRGRKEERKKLEVGHGKSSYTTNTGKLQIKSLLTGRVLNIDHQPLESEVRLQEQGVTDRF